jgi:AraC-like DNA-binding protein
MHRGGTVSVVLVRPLVLAIAGDEASLASFYRATDLTPEMLADTEARITASQFCVAWAQATELSKGGEPLALRLAHAIPQGAFGVVEYVCRSAPTLGDAITQWVRYLGLLDDAVGVALVAEKSGASALRVIEESEAPAPASHELCFAVIAKQARAMIGARYHTARIAFEHASTNERARAFERFFECEVRFGAPHTEMVFASEVLAAKLPSADPSLLDILLRAADKEQRERPVGQPLTEQVRRVLRGWMKGGAIPVDGAELEPIAKQLGLGGRSLQRRLKDEGTSFQALRDETRRHLADRYLEEGLSIAEVSFLLGFSEPSAFFRAFKRWTGSTPGASLLAR